MCRLRPVVLALVTMSLLPACADQSRSARQYQLEGQVLDIHHADSELLIKHGDIKGFMPGMTMPFKVRESSLLEGLASGDLVRATLQVEDTYASIVTLQKIGSAPLPEGTSIPPASFVTPLQPGDAAPDTTLSDASGADFTLSQWRGSAVAVTFMYVRCPLPQFCPLLDRRFAEVQRAIVADAQLAGRARLLSVSFDPDADTSARLKAHALRLAADPAIWRFATAPREIVDRFAAHFGVNVIRERDGTITHNMRTTVIGPDGRVRRVYEGSDWTPTHIVDDMRRALVP